MKVVMDFAIGEVKQGKIVIVHTRCVRKREKRLILEMMEEKFDFFGISEKMMQFIDASPSCFHVVDNLMQELQKCGYQELPEDENWKIVPGQCYFTTRNHSSLIAFQLPEQEPEGLLIMAGHSDSPCYKIKENPEIKSDGNYVKLNTEGYGGMIHASWLDRPLSFAGRVYVKGQEGGIREVLVAPDQDLLIIPNLAIHMNREVNQGFSYNAQVDMLPIWGMGEENGTFSDFLSKVTKVEVSDLLGYDLFLVNRQKASFLGQANEWVGSARLDDLQCVFGIKEGFLQSRNSEYITVLAVFDNEEVGSTTRQGADSTFLSDTLERIAEGIGMTNSRLKQMLAGSFLVSADNAHAVHPNHPEKADPVNRPKINEGIVLKYHGGQKYTTDGYSATVVKMVGKRAEVPIQIFTNRSDMTGGSTLGNISNSHVSIRSADIGLPQLSMHSAYEVAGVKDTAYLAAFSKTFYESGSKDL